MKLLYVPLDVAEAGEVGGWAWRREGDEPRPARQPEEVAGQGGTTGGWPREERQGEDSRTGTWPFGQLPGPHCWYWLGSRGDSSIEGTRGGSTEGTRGGSKDGTSGGSKDGTRGGST